MVYFFFLVALLVYFLPLLLHNEGGETSPTEAGFTLVGERARGAFSVQFFILIIIFIIFDLEIVFLFGLLTFKSTVLIIVLMVFVLGTLWLERALSKLEWAS